MLDPMNNWTNMSYNEIYRGLRYLKIKKRQTRPNLQSTISELVTEDGCKVYLVGTVHFSRESVRDVQQIIQQVQPDAVVIELCQDRKLLLTLDEQTLLNEAKECDLYKMQKAMNQFGVMPALWLMVFLKLSAYVTEQLGIAPGGEFRKAFREAQKIPFCNIYFGDRPIFITLNRCAATLSFWKLVKMFLGVLCLNSQSVPVGKEIMEQIKQKGMLEQTIKTATEEFPEFHRIFISERDVYLTHSLKQAARPIVLPQISQSDPQQVIPSVVVGVVGIGHVAGIKKNWNRQLNIQELMRVPNPSLPTRILRFVFGVTLYGLKIFFYYKIAQTLIWLFD
ncbi:traB domain-containing protein-like [Heptranchias perlo]|uniref:traB domain-containing protein-like n=1 Tax=Heptranchias perlo TaxID=212740 RepID=UPI0035599CF5